MCPSSFWYLRLSSSPSPSLSPLHLHLPPDSKVGSAPNSSVSIAYWHGNRLIICLYINLAETEIFSLKYLRQDKKINKPRLLFAHTHNQHLPSCWTSSFFIVHCLQVWGVWRGSRKSKINKFLRIASCTKWIIFLKVLIGQRDGGWV